MWWVAETEDIKTIQNISGFQKTLGKELEGGLVVRVRRKKQTKLERNKYVERDVKENFTLEEGDSIQSWN